MARATIIHNRVAGDGHPTGGELRALVQAQGFAPCYDTTDSDLDTLLQDPGDLVIVAGGDGTVGQVAARLGGRGVPLAILPIGTANNLATSLGIVGPIDLLVAEWTSARHRPLNVGTATGPWGARPFVESFGLGLFPHAMPVLSALKKQDGEAMVREQQIRHDRIALRRLLDQFVPRSVELKLDGRTFSGEYLMVEVLNAPMLGPRLCFAPRADPGDGRLDVLLVRQDDRRRLTAWLEEDPESDPGLPLESVRRIEIDWNGDPLHIDGESWAGESSPFRNVQTVSDVQRCPVTVELEPHTVPVLVPSR
jgi:diacylglycerol kinase (ATP)